MNMMIFNSIMDTVDRCPYTPRSKMVMAEGTAMALQAGASALGNVLGLGSAISSNKTNLQIARENNQAQRELFHEQMAYNTDMWNKQNQYNLPVNQVQRLLAAGINPAAVYGNGTMSEAGQLTAPNAPNLQQAHVSPYDFDFSGVGQAVNAYYQNQLINEQKKKTAAEAKHTEFMTLEGNKKLLPTLEFLNNQAKKEGVLGDIARSQLAYAQDSYYWNLKQLRNEVRAQDDQSRYMQKQSYNMELQNGLMEVQLAYQPKMSEAELRQYYLTGKQIQAQIGLINANMMLTNEERLHEIEKKTGTIIDNGMRGIDFKVKDAVKKYIIGQERERLYQMEDDRFYRPFEFNYKYQGKAGQYLPMPSGQYGAAKGYERNQKRDRF